MINQNFGSKIINNGDDKSEDNSNPDQLRILHGDCREVLTTLPSESVHCCPTSPPYWGLRDYGLPPTIWGGDAQCLHDWTEVIQPAANGIRHAEGMSGPTLSSVSATRKPKISGSCQKCGAWRGQLDLEPTCETRTLSGEDHCNLHERLRVFSGELKGLKEHLLCPWRHRKR